MNHQSNNIPEYKVSEFNKIFNETVTTAFSLIKIKGEVSNLKKHYSGHIYFNLKDENSIINAVCWKINKNNLSIQPEEGLEVIAKGKISTYAKSISVYQLNVENIEVAGQGALLKLIEERKKKLQKKGYFDEGKKKSIPYLPNSVGLITSPTGSVLKDIIHRIRERFPMTIQLWPVPVQGKNASKAIISAIKNFNNINFPDPPEVIIIARGGGSIEDLMPFNDEELAKEIFNSKIPIISAIGHETDNTIIDYVSDLRVPTPTAAAEKCVPVKSDLSDRLNFQNSDLNNAIKQLFFHNKEILDKYKRLLQDPSNILSTYQTRLFNLIDKKNYIIKNIFDNYKEKLKNFSRLLNLSSIEETLKRGFTVIEKNKKILINPNLLKKNDLVDIKFYNKKVLAKIKKN